MPSIADANAERTQLDSALRRQSVGFLLSRSTRSEPSLDDEAVLLGSPSALPSNEESPEEEREDKESIDEQLHAWADGRPHWITNAALPQQQHRAAIS
jgi:hypothetical protein